MKKLKARDLAVGVAHRYIYPFVVRFWAACFALAGTVLRPAAHNWSTSGNERVLVVAPHPDDEVLGCGGTMGRHILAGDHVSVVIVTDGARSRAHGLGSRAMAARRAIEAEAAARRLGIAELVQLGLREGRVSVEVVERHLAEVIGHVRPTIIYAPSIADYHPEHRRTARALAGTLQQIHARCAVRVYEIQVPLTPVLANVICRIGQSAAGKKLALQAYHTQHASFSWQPRESTYLRKLYGSAQGVEVFWELRATGYCRVMFDGKAGRRFRGLSGRPWTDPLAWLVGLTRRRALRALSTRGPDMGAEPVSGS